MATRFSRLFDDWDHDYRDISMLDFGSNTNDSPPKYHSSHIGTECTSSTADLSQRPESILERSEATIDFTSCDNGMSSRCLLDGRGSYATRSDPLLSSAHDFQALRDISRQSLTDDSPSEPRLRSGNAVTSKIRSIWMSSTAFTRPRPSSTFDGRFAQGEGGWWKKQMRLNKHSTSVGGKDGESCEGMESKNIAIHLFINIAATMILGSWLLLIITSIPVHFLANSVIGSSFYIEMPTNVTYNYSDVGLNSTQILNDLGPHGLMTFYDSACWTSLRAGLYVLPNNMSQLSDQYKVEMPGKSTSFKTVSVTYNKNCTAYKGTASVYEALKEVDYIVIGTGEYRIGNCSLLLSAACVLGEPRPKKCRLNVRMQSCFMLFGCLLIKAIYMIGLNYLARHRVKNNCLTYGDVIVASVINPDLKIHNECLLNSGDGHRHKVTHRCHKHCKDPVPSASGLPHPTIAIKSKRSLLSSLGSTAITQMLILMFCSFAMVGVSVMLATKFADRASVYHRYCKYNDSDNYWYREYCGTSLSQALKENYGTRGGFSSSATLASLPPDKISSELLAFAISNGAQFLFSLLYLLLIYNVTLIYMEHEWGTFELQRKKPRATIVSGTAFEQSYFLQLPPKILLPLMTFAAAMHWLLGQSISTVESVYADPMHGIEHSVYHVTYAAYPIFLSSLLMVGQTAVCWWAFTYRREGFIPQMYGSIRACCASTSELEDFGNGGIQWGD
ncbi:33baad1a-6dfe-4dc4-a074-25ebd4144f31 [Sclerotinia trifoliorum]|uniref:33baad1a-6dfe-4dc4-a074-25ebd4144f31 n=1 Tax=Sclerotinia trifoliorum TaxID=28548 RepID=A0A8H2VPU1_9HELO|nr:33baad1a-6dfe-4dc4-a074-25ebd4144f31 [Sclerotinia trifoliorum]